MPARVVFAVCVLLGGACATYYETSIRFNQQFEQGNLQQALAELHANPKIQKPAYRFLYYVNAGIAYSLMGLYEESNNWFEKAYLFGEDYRINIAREAASYLTNPLVTIYRGEDHEHLMVLYYKAMNFAKMARYEEALVECRRLNIRLQQLSDRYTSENRYREDAFIHNLMGILYQATGDWNNAFIAYRNAYRIYSDFYSKNFGIDPPLQLKYDLLKAAYKTGFVEEYESYKTHFGIAPLPADPKAELLLFWHNGLAPVKVEWSINFVIYKVRENKVVIANPDLGLQYTFEVTPDEWKNLSNLEFFRVAFPKYSERPTVYHQGFVQTRDSAYRLELAEDINRIAHLCLKERMEIEFSKALVRVALKKAAEYSARKENRTMGSVIGAINTMTEAADTRNWQTLPHSIYYIRVPLKEGNQTLRLNLKGATHETTQEFTYSAKKGQTLFHTYTSLETYAAR